MTTQPAACCTPQFLSFRYRYGDPIVNADYFPQAVDDTDEEVDIAKIDSSKIKFDLLHAHITEITASIKLKHARV